jgi:hypothetical protein
MVQDFARIKRRPGNYSGKMRKYLVRKGTDLVEG